jgi:hypothetical protein
MKKAYTVKFTITTRVIEDEDTFQTREDFEDHIAQKGIDQIGDEIWDYLSIDRLESVKEDKNFPYGDLEDVEE